MSAVWPYFAAIVPTILVAILFYFLIKGMLEGDRRERLAQSALRGRGGPPAGHGRRRRPSRRDPPHRPTTRATRTRRGAGAIRRRIPNLYSLFTLRDFPADIVFSDIL